MDNYHPLKKVKKLRKSFVAPRNRGGASGAGWGGSRQPLGNLQRFNSPYPPSSSSSLSPSGSSTTSDNLVFFTPEMKAQRKIDKSNERRETHGAELNARRRNLYRKEADKKN